MVEQRTRSKRGAYAKSAARKAQIVESATIVFSTRGYHGGSLREISAAIDVSLTSLVHHFPNKTDLLAAVLQHAEDLYIGDFAVIAQDRGLRFAVLDLVERNFGHPELLRLFATLAPECSSPDHPGYSWFFARYQRLRDAYAERFAHDQSVGRITLSTPANELAALLIGTWDGLQLQWLIDPSIDMKALVSRFFDEIGAAAD